MRAALFYAPQFITACLVTSPPQLTPHANPLLRQEAAPFTSQPRGFLLGTKTGLHTRRQTSRRRVIRFRWTSQAKQGFKVCCGYLFPHFCTYMSSHVSLN